jgi:hypothetical protein
MGTVSAGDFMTDRAFRTATLLAYAIGLALLIGLVVRFCEGHFIYTLDDPYIHLALAENIARGVYGINLQEYSSPSSSILFPLLLAPFTLIGIDRFAPLLLGVLSNAVSLWIIAGFFYRHVIADASGMRTWAWALVIPLLLLSMNAVALPLVGMEHPLHLLTVVLTITGLVRFGETGQIGGRLAAGVLLAPLIRFEGLALSGAVLLILIIKGRTVTAVALGATLAAALAGYGLFMHAHELPLIPSSVMVKSTISADAMNAHPLTVLQGIALNAAGALLIRQGLLLAIASVLMVRVASSIRFGAIKPGEAGALSPEARSVVAFAGVAAMIAHLLLGTYGWFGRYEVYVFGIMLLTTCYVLSDSIRQVGPAWRRIAMCALALAMLGFSFSKATLNTPAAARNVYEQQWQMHRFVTEFFPRAVAVNDLGAVSYRNDRFVLDLWGLGSEEVRKLRKEDQLTAKEIDGLVQRRGVPLAMIYDGWFPNAIPADWKAVARLTTSQVVSADTTVTFYVTRPAYEREIVPALRRFAADLPKGAKLSIVEKPATKSSIGQAQ